MNLYMNNLNRLEERQYYVVLPKKYEENKTPYPVVYLNGDKQVISLLKNQHFISELKYILVIIISENRLNDFSPWYAASENKKSHDFGGKGEDYIKWILDVLKPKIDLSYRTLGDSENTAIMGQSIGGLISLFCLCKTDKFSYAACISPSCWFPGFIEYLKKNIKEKNNLNVYISTGSLEGADHEDSRKHAVKSTEEIYGILASKFGTDSVTMYRDGGRHQDYLLQRFKSAMLWLENKFESAKG